MPPLPKIIAPICMWNGCAEFGCWGFEFGKVILCYEHKKLYEKNTASPEIAATTYEPVQGRLL